MPFGETGISAEGDAAFGVIIVRPRAGGEIFA